MGGLLLDNTAFDRVIDLVSAADFYRFDHRLIFQQIAKLVAATKPADVITVFESLSSLGKAEEVGGLPTSMPWHRTRLLRPTSGVMPRSFETAAYFAS